MVKKIRAALDEREIVSKHFAKLLRLVREESRLERDDYQSQIKQKSPDERQKRGAALLKLRLADLRYTASGGRLLAFASTSRRPIPRYGLQVGEIVELSGYKIDDADKPVGTIYEKDPKLITVLFNRSIPSWVGRLDTYDLIAARNQTTYERMVEAIHEVGHSGKTRVSALRDISLGLRQSAFSDPVKEEQLKFFNSNLNEKQKRAVCRSMENEDFFLLHGPPGTGKTSVLLEIIRQARARDEKVLVSAPSNTACDHLLEKIVQVGLKATRLGNPARMNAALRENLFSYQLSKHPYAKQIYKIQAEIDLLYKQRDRKIDRRVLDYQQKRESREEIQQLKNEVKQLRANIFKQVWDQSEIVVATHTHCADLLLKEKVFDWVIIDEATQGTEPSTWIALQHAGRVVMAGDPCQLPPTVLAKRNDNALSVSMFERLQRELPEECKVKLTLQYRMHPHIMSFSSKEFYLEKLEAFEGTEQHVLKDWVSGNVEEDMNEPLIFLDTAGMGFEENQDPGTRSTYNMGEAKLVCKQFKQLTELGVAEKDIAIISPYAAQVKRIAGMLYEDEWDAEDVTRVRVDSIDAFQGQEKDVILVSLVRANLEGNLGFLNDLRRLNVAFTRAKRKLIVVGDSATLSSLPFFERFIAEVETKNGYRSAWEFVDA